MNYNSIRYHNLWQMFETIRTTYNSPLVVAPLQGHNKLDMTLSSKTLPLSFKILKSTFLRAVMMQIGCPSDKTSQAT